MSTLEERVAKLEQEMARNWKVMARLHMYLVRAARAVEAGFNLLECVKFAKMGKAKHNVEAHVERMKKGGQSNGNQERQV